MHNSLWDTRDISYSGCAAQVFLIFFFISAELCLLTIMCYDRYVSICKPLHYGTVLGSRACAHMAAAAWASAFLNALMHIANTFSLPLCHGNALDQFFSEIPQILKLSCSQSNFRELGLIAVSVCLAFGCFVFIVFSYVQIFRAVLRIPSDQGRHKAFSTCLPHLAVVTLFISTSFFTYLKPPSMSSPSLDLALSVLYSVVPPALNPLIYSLRNQELKAALWRLMTGCFCRRQFVAEQSGSESEGASGSFSRDLLDRDGSLRTALTTDSRNAGGGGRPGRQNSGDARGGQNSQEPVGKVGSNCGAGPGAGGGRLYTPIEV
ncbi:olfactory receptor 14A16-like [Melospiza georgiana]|uniref:olfactory receptor 14A16-like n=1 Tax=Melospiza georgiana TaxID=44398 RepID=UPI0025AC93F9|nr:olfactory receptor 14A16-like [Melospiza georgiana]